MLNYQKKGMVLNVQDIVLIIVKMTKKLKFLRDNGTLSFRNEPSLPEKMQRTMFAVDTIQLTFNCLRSTTETL